MTTPKKENVKESIKLSPPPQKENEKSSDEFNKTLVLLKSLGIMIGILILWMIVGTLLYSMVLSVDNSESLILLKTSGDGFFETLLFNLRQAGVQDNFHLFLFIKEHIPKWGIVWVLPFIMPILFILYPILFYFQIIRFWFFGVLHTFSQGYIFRSILYSILYFILFWFPFPVFTFMSWGIVLYALYKISSVEKIPVFLNILKEYGPVLSFILMNVTTILCFAQHGWIAGLIAAILTIILLVVLYYHM
jgi:hypothetical protein